jgi:RNA polymerase sigma-70 factor (ECF subfamily)
MPDLIERWQSGDSDAFEALFRQYEKLVFRTAYLIVGDVEKAEDVIQEVFVSVWKSRHTFNPEKGKFTTWLHRITVNKCSRKQSKQQPVFLSLEETQEKGFQPESNDDLPEELMINREEYNELMKALSALDTKYRSVVVLRYFSELSCEEIAQAVDIPLGTVKSRLHHALKSLRTIYAEKSENYGL